MARISQLLSFAYALALGSLFISASGHVPPMQPRISTIPETVSELQTLPFTEITQILNRFERSAPKSVEFKAMFTICKGYVAYLESLYKVENPIVDVLGVAKAKYTLMSRAILAAGATISSKVDKKTSLKLKKISAGFTKELLKIQETIIAISAKHNFNPNTKITFRESKIICDAIITFKQSINAFMDIIYEFEEKKFKKISHHARVRKEYSVKNVFGDKYVGNLGGKPHGRELTEDDVKSNVDSHGGADINGFEAFVEKFSHFFGGYLGSSNNLHGRELTEAQASGKTKGSFRFGGKVHFNAAGKMKFVGKDGFRPLKRAQYKHFV